MVESPFFDFLVSENLHEFVILLKETIPALKLSHEINLWDFFTEKMKIIPFLYLDWDIFS